MTIPLLTIVPVNRYPPFSWHFSHSPLNETGVPLHAIWHNVSYVSGNGSGILYLLDEVKTVETLAYLINKIGVSPIPFPEFFKKNSTITLARVPA